MSGFNVVTEAEAEDWQREFIMDYGQAKSLLPQQCAQTGWLSGTGTVHFTIVQNDQITTTRGANGDIVYRNGNQAEISVDLEECLGAEEIDNFTAFKSSVDQRKIMYARVEGAIERKKDDIILTELDGTPNAIDSDDMPDLGSGSTGFVLSRQHAQEITSLFHEMTVGADGSATALITIRAFAYLESQVQISSRDYNDDMPLVKGYKPFRWQGILWLPYARGLSGAGTATAKCWLFHNAAVQFKEAGTLGMIVDFDKKHRKFFCNGQEWAASKRVLDDGVLEFLHKDDAAFPA